MLCLELKLKNRGSMNNHCVPDFEIQMDEEEEEEDYSMPIASSTPKKSSVQNDDIMELLWQNGQVVLQSQNQRQLRKPPPVRNTGAVAAEPSSAREAENYLNQNLFMQEDEMASWLHFSIDEDPPLDHRDLCTGMLYSPPPNHGGATEIRPVASPRPLIPTERRIQNFAHFAKHGNARAETAALRPLASLKYAASAHESTVVDSCETPVAAAVSRSSAEHGETDRWNTIFTGKEVSSAGGGETATATFEMTVTSSPGGSSGCANPVPSEPVMDRKRKGREVEDSEIQSEDVEFDSPEAKIQVRGKSSTKRSRAAEVHNLSERRRRDRINEKMKALQELIPRCNKTDKASMLDEAIEYLKSLQLQVQMMSMGCGMLPMMLPGMQQYMPPMGMGIGMSMGMEMGMNRPVIPFPNMLAKSSALPAATTAPTHHLGPRFSMPPHPFHVPHVNAPDPSKMQAANHSDNQSHISNFTDPYQQYLGPHQVHLHLMQTINQPNATKPSTSKGQENPEKHQPEQS